MNNKDLRSLELDKILARLAANTSCADTADAACSITPDFTLDGAQRLLDETSAAFMLLARFGGPSFGGISNVKGALARADAGAVLSMRELLDIGETLRVIRSLKEWRSRFENVETCLDERFSLLYPNKFMEDRINSCIISEDEIADNASPTLADIRRKIRSAGNRVREQLDKMIRSAAYKKALQESIVTIRDGRFVIPVKAEHRGEIPGLVHDSSASGATLFVEPVSVVEANNEIRVLQGREAEEIDRILSELSAQVGGFCQSISAGYDIAVELDLIFAKAQLAYSMKASAPALNNEGRLLLKKARHPLLDQKTAVPVDISLGNDFDTLVITGPNTGGKTVSIKTIGLLTLMAMCGLMIPADHGSEISVFSKILVDIGDEQSIEQSLSTFSAHMTNTKRIIAEADGHSLVLLDELGAGTDPIEGAALAVSILERLRQQGAIIAATTHYAELKAYALKTVGVENGSCEFDVATLRPTYRLLIGIPGRSNAFAISERLGIPEEVVSNAKKLVSAEDTQFENVVSSLLQSKQELEKEKESAEAMRAEAERAISDANTRKSKISAQEEAIINEARRRAADIVEKAQAESNRLIEELEALKKQAKNNNAADMVARARAQAKSGMRNLQDISDPVETKHTGNYKLPRNLRIGDTVRIVDIDKKGTVLELPDANSNVLVQAGIIKTRVNLSNLQLIQDDHTKQPSGARRTRRTVESTLSRSASAELDLRGQNIEEGILELDRFIDNAILSGIQQISIIHGKGTGVLRAGIQQHLRKHPSVRTFRLGVYGEGAEGVTIAELK